MHSLDLSALHTQSGRDAALKIIRGDPLITDGQREGFQRLIMSPSELAGHETPNIDGFDPADLFIDMMARAPMSLFSLYMDAAQAARRFSPRPPVWLSRSMPPLMRQSRLPDPKDDPAIEAGYEHLSLGEPTRSGMIVVLSEPADMVPAAMRLVNHAGMEIVDDNITRYALYDPANGYLVVEDRIDERVTARQRMGDMIREAFGDDVPHMVPVTLTRRMKLDGSYTMKAEFPMDRPTLGPFERYATEVLVRPESVVLKLGAKPGDDAGPLLFEYSGDFRKAGLVSLAGPLYRVEATIAQDLGKLGALGMLELVAGNRRIYADTVLTFEGASKLYTIGNRPHRKDDGPLSEKEFPAGSRRAFFAAGPQARPLLIALWHFLEAREFDPARFGIEVKPYHTPGDMIMAMIDKGVGSMMQLEALERAEGGEGTDGMGSFGGVMGPVKAKKPSDGSGGGGGGNVCQCYQTPALNAAGAFSALGLTSFFGKFPIR